MSVNRNQDFIEDDEELSGTQLKNVNFEPKDVNTKRVGLINHPGDT